MMQNRTKQYILTGVFLGMGIILPAFFHYTGLNGRIFLPMHIPVLISGYFISPYFALLLGMVTPLINSVLTGMPVLFPMGVIMVVELGVYGFTISTIYQRIKNKIIVLAISMVMGRVFAGLMVFILSITLGVKLNPIVYVKGAIVTGLPGIVIQLILIPTLVVALEKALGNKKVTG